MDAHKVVNELSHAVLTSPLTAGALTPQVISRVPAAMPNIAGYLARLPVEPEGASGGPAELVHFIAEGSSDGEKRVYVHAEKTRLHQNTR